MGRAGRAFLHAAMGRRSPVDAAVVGAAARHGSRLRGSVYADRRTTARQRRLSIQRRRRTAAAVRVRRRLARRFRSDDVPSETKFSLGFGGGVKYFFSRSVGVRGHIRYKPTMLNDTASGDFCDPFGFCQGTLQQVEFAAGAVLRF